MLKDVRDLSKKDFLYVTFYTTTDAIAAEEILKTNNIKGRLVLIPRELSAGCGMAWRSNKEDQDEVKIILKENDIHPDQLAIL